MSIERHVIDLWYVFLDKAADPRLEAEYHRLLSPDEVRRHERFIPPQVRHQFLVSHALVRTTLSHYSDVDPRGWQFQFTAHGKPSIGYPTGLPWQFNLSHTRGLAVCAVSHSHGVGVDAEGRDKRIDCMSLARRFFHAAEAAALEGSGADHERGLFFKIWTLKEAYLKACGTGLSTPLDSFWFTLEPGRAPRISFAAIPEEPVERWQFAQFQPDDRYEIAVAAALPVGERLQVRVRETVPLAWLGPWRTPAGEHPGR